MRDRMPPEKAAAAEGGSLTANHLKDLGMIVLLTRETRLTDQAQR